MKNLALLCSAGVFALTMISITAMAAPVGDVGGFIPQIVTGCAVGDFVPQVAVVMPNAVYAPTGFDNNDNAQVVVDAELRSTCWKAGNVKVKVDSHTKTIYLRNQIYVYTGCWCAEVVTPYMHTVNLGVLPSGRYSVVAEDDRGEFTKVSELEIAMATKREPDDYLYAPVEEAAMRGLTLGLRGTFTNTCMKMQEIKVVQKSRDVIEVLPIVVMSSENCQRERRPFTAKIELHPRVSGRYLIHVRSLNGQALNLVQDL